MLIEVRVVPGRTLAATLRAAGEGLAEACEMLRRRGLDRLFIRISGARKEREQGTIALVWRVCPEGTPRGDIWERKAARKINR